MEILKAAGYENVAALANAPDEHLLRLDDIGPQTLKRIRSTVAQAIWM